MRKVLYSTFLISILFSCQKQSDPVFQEKASARIEKSFQEYDKELKSSENGWILQYYPGEDQDKGGYNYYLNFKDNNLVEVALGQDTPQQTEYNIHQNGGVVLSFVTYNSDIHRFATPTTLTPSGQQGDFEFQLTSLKQDEILLTGLKYRSKMRMVRLKESRASYIEKLDKVKSYLSKAILGYKNQSVIEKFSFDAEKGILTFNGEKISFVYTDRGISLQKSISLGGEEIQEFILDEEREKLVSLDTKTELLLAFLPIDLATKGWFVNAENPSKDEVSEKLTRVWQQAKQNSKRKYGHRTLSNVINLGRGKRSYEKGLWIKSYTRFPRGVTIQYIYSFLASFENSNRVEIRSDRGGLYWSLFDHISPLVDAIEGEYVVESYDPAYDGSKRYKFTKVNDGDFYFVLTEIK